MLCFLKFMEKHRAMTAWPLEPRSITEELFLFFVSLPGLDSSDLQLLFWSWVFLPWEMIFMQWIVSHSKPIPSFLGLFWINLLIKCCSRTGFWNVSGLSLMWSFLSLKIINGLLPVREKTSLHCRFRHWHTFRLESVLYLATSCEMIFFSFCLWASRPFHVAQFKSALCFFRTNQTVDLSSCTVPVITLIGLFCFWSLRATHFHLRWFV